MSNELYQGTIFDLFSTEGEVVVEGTENEGIVSDCGCTETTCGEESAAKPATSSIQTGKSSLSPKSSTTKKKGATATKPVVKKEPEPPIIVTGEWTVVLQGLQTFEVQDFVPNIPEEGIELEVLREGIFRGGYTAFDKDKVVFDCDKENKRVFAFAKGGAKG